MNGRTISRYLLAAALCLLPLTLLYSSWRTFHELDEQKRVYLRERVAQVAARLETLPADALSGPGLSPLDLEPNLHELAIISRDMAEARQPFLRDIWEGHELYRTEFADSAGHRVYRAYVPFHLPGGEMRIARIDLDARAADFLVVHARHNIMFSLAGGIAVVLLSIYAVWAARRSAALETRQLELEHLARLGRLSATLAHEIRNPLGTIKGFTQLALESGGQQSILAPVLTETKRLENLVNALLAYGRPPAPSMRRVSWRDVSEGFEGAGARVRVAPANVEFTTDPELLHQALWNLVRNGVDAVAGKPDGEVTVDVAAEPGGKLRITVADNGPGIPPDTIDKVFEPFFTSKAFGTGLGLPISQQLVRTLGGELELRNREPRGAEARITLGATEPAWAVAQVANGTNSNR